MFRAGLPQASVLLPSLFLLWAAPLVNSLRAVPDAPRPRTCTYADDTATLCRGPDINIARRRAQAAADTLIAWAKLSKMVVSGEKTEVLVLSQ